MADAGRTPVGGILLLYHRPLRPGAATVMEHVGAFGRHSRFPVFALNTEIGFPRELSRFRFSVVALHYSLWETSGYRLDDRFRAYLLDAADGFKVAFYQDEHHFCRQRFAFINDYGIDCVFTLLEPDQVARVYGRYTKVPRVVSHIPGYVAEEMVANALRFRRPRAERTIDVGYRGRELPPYMGRGAREKTEIAEEFLRRTRGRPIRTDIATKEARRFYGDDWYRFVGNCKAVLGVEAGVSVFDLEDAVRPEGERLLRENPRIPFEELEERLLRPWEGNVYYRTVSPRHFEAAAFLTCQILYEGRYSGVLEPMRHYIPLRKDFSNFEEVLRMAGDEALAAEIAGNAWTDLIASGNYGYDRFIRAVDEEILAAGAPMGIDAALRERVDAALRSDYAARHRRARVRSLRSVPFPGRRPLVRLVKFVLGRS